MSLDPPPSGPALHCDVLVVGGGINGCGIARDLAGRGWSVLLCEQDDLAAHTSSASTKLVHGGLRYLEHGEFALVRKALGERERLLRSAPHLTRPLEFVLPHDPALRPAWMLRAGLLLYDHLARRSWLPASRGIDLRSHPVGALLKPEFARGYSYSDGWVDDARLVVAVALDAAQRGADVRTRTRCTAAQRGADGWQATLVDAQGATRRVAARALVNAAGPWAERFLRTVARPVAGEPLARRSLRLVQGSHIVVARRPLAPQACLFPGRDRRVVFAIPYEDDHLLVGTTDVEFDGDPAQARIDAAETAYLFAQANRYLRVPLRPDELRWSYAGVRPLLDDAAGTPSAVTRDHLIETDHRPGAAAPLLTVWGGKLTTYRLVAEQAGDALGRMLGERRAAWTAAALLPGADLSAWIGAPQRPDLDMARYIEALAQTHPWLPAPLARRLARAYGSRIDRVLGGATRLAGLGEELLPGLHEAELAYLRREEWTRDADDLLWRRTKLGLRADAAQRERLAQRLAAGA